MTDYSAFPYNCEECHRLHMCRYHELYDQHEQIIEVLHMILVQVDDK